MSVLPRYLRRLGVAALLVSAMVLPGDVFAACDPQLTCGGHGTCDSNDACVCAPGYAGPQCNQCAPNHFGYPACTFCQASTTCNGHGICTASGQCSCDPGYAGAGCSQCAANFYNYPACTFCLASSTCNGEGACDPRGGCVCDDGFCGPSCSPDPPPLLAGDPFPELTARDHANAPFQLSAERGKAVLLHFFHDVVPTVSDRRLVRGGPGARPRCADRRRQLAARRRAVPGRAAFARPPVIAGRKDVVVETRAAPVRVAFTTPPAVDGVDGNVPVSCLPRSGSLFPFGKTPVDCTASDSAGNTSRSSFAVIVRTPTTAGAVTNPGNDTPLTSVAPGRRVRVSAGGFAPGSAVTLLWLGPDGEMFSLGRTTAAASGRIDAFVKVPKDAPTGTNQMTALGVDPLGDDFVRAWRLEVAGD